MGAKKGHAMLAWRNGQQVWYCLLLLILLCTTLMLWWCVWLSGKMTQKEEFLLLFSTWTAPLPSDHSFLLFPLLGSLSTLLFYFFAPFFSPDFCCWRWPWFCSMAACIWRWCFFFLVKRTPNKRSTERVAFLSGAVRKEEEKSQRKQRDLTLVEIRDVTWVMLLCNNNNGGRIKITQYPYTSVAKSH